MRDTSIISFDPFRLDISNEQLWHGQEAIRLTPKAFTVLQYLVEHATQLATKDALLDTLWPDTYVSETALAVCIREIRQALGDRARSPRFIETVHRRGYRFIAPTTPETPPLERPHLASRQPSTSHAVNPMLPARIHVPRVLVSREAELSQLQQWFMRALHGERQVGFITGEAGIGKTALIDAFVAQINPALAWRSP